MKVFLLCLFVLFFFPLRSQIKVSRDSASMMLQDSFINNIYFQTNDKEKAFEKYMDLNKSKGNVQGGACFKDYLFVGYDRNTIMDVYNLSTLSFVCTIKMDTPEPKSRCHANTINFGSQYYKKDDDFPLLYVSSGYSISKTDDKSIVYVYRIIRKNQHEDSFAFNSELVQKISIIGPGGWSECITDNENEALWFRYDRIARRCFLKYPVPDVRLEIVEIDPTKKPAIDTIIIRNFSVVKHCQGMVCYDRNFYIPSGVPSWGDEPYLSIISLEKKDYTHIVNLYDMEMFNRFSLNDINWEPEFFFIYNGGYFMGYRSAIYKLNMDLMKESNYFYNINCR